MANGVHIINLIRKQQINRDLKKASRRYYKKYAGNLQSDSDIETKRFNFEKFPDKSEDEKKEIRQAVKADLRNEMFKTNLKTVLVLLTLSIFIWFLIN
tara:strand:+ start:811 stop:1104 length:294 start_codon:yes stop_codon:yes gene_type:complete